MSAPTQVIPIQLDLDDCELEDDFETLDDSAEPTPLARVLGFLKSPIGIGVSVVLVAGIVAAVVLGGGSLQMLGKPQSNHNGALAGDGGIVSEEFVAQPKLEGEGEDDEPVEEEEPEDEFSSEYGSITFANDGAVYHTVPTTVRVKANGGRTQLTLSVGIVTDTESAQSLLENGLSVNLMKIAAAEALELGPYLDWQIPGLVTKDIKARLEAAYPDLNIRGIMIRDFRLA